MGVCWWFLALKKNPAKILNLEQLKNTKENTCNSSDLLGGEARIPYTSRTQLQVRSDWLAKHSGSRAVVLQSRSLRGWFERPPPVQLGCQQEKAHLRTHLRTPAYNL